MKVFGTALKKVRPAAPLYKIKRGRVIDMMEKLTSLRNSRKKGFTLIELIVVIAILAILAMIAIPAYNGLKEESAEQVAISNARTVYTAYKAVEATGKVPNDTNVAAMLGDDMTGSIKVITDGVQWSGEINGKVMTATYTKAGGQIVKGTTE